MCLPTVLWPPGHTSPPGRTMPVREGRYFCTASSSPIGPRSPVLRWPALAKIRSYSTLPPGMVSVSGVRPMPIIVWPLTGVYAACLLLFCLHVADKLHLTLNFFRPRKRNSSLPPLAPSDVDAPYVTVQLPIFNEKYVVEGLIDAATRLSYPAGRLEIQVIDDSDDETIHLAEAKVQEYQATGVN